MTIDKGFSLSQPKFFAEFDKLLASAPVSEWQAYLRFHAIDGASAVPVQGLPGQQVRFLRQDPGRPAGAEAALEAGARWRQRVDGRWRLGQLYVAKVFTPEAKQRAEELVTNVRNALKARIENLDWMSDETKAKAIDKWNTFLPKIGYPDKGEWRNWSGLEISPDN